MTARDAMREVLRKVERARDQVRSMHFKHDDRYVVEALTDALAALARAEEQQPSTTIPDAVRAVVRLYNPAGREVSIPEVVGGDALMDALDALCEAVEEQQPAPVEWTREVRVERYAHGGGRVWREEAGGWRDLVLDLYGPAERREAILHALGIAEPEGV